MTARTAAARIALLDTVGSILKQKGNAVWWLPPDASVYDAIALMAEKGVGALLVCSRSQLLGIVSERDYARKVILKGRSSTETRVEEIMTSPVFTVTCTDTLERCLHIITEQRIRHLPVLEEGAVAGVVSIGDLVKVLIEAQALTIQELQRYITGDYPA